MTDAGITTTAVKVTAVVDVVFRDVWLIDPAVFKTKMLEAGFSNEAQGFGNKLNEYEWSVAPMDGKGNQGEASSHRYVEFILTILDRQQCSAADARCRVFRFIDSLTEMFPNTTAKLKALNIEEAEKQEV